MDNESKMQFKPEQKTFFVVDFSEIERLVKETYGQEFEFPCDQESMNGVSYRWSIDGKVSEYNRKKIQVFQLSGKHSFLACPLMDDLCARGIIPPGEYLIEVSW